eukprot:Seg7250.1 transcript_id=Seg7250.1/GoldUCD/mRNA.D3Y31 product="hypothetical protein" protein_id=Seg7250.1/GoldUCD/D3Y31
MQLETNSPRVLNMALKIVFSLVVWWSITSSCHGCLGPDGSGQIRSRRANPNLIPLRISSLPHLTVAQGGFIEFTCTTAVFHRSSLKWYKRTGGIDEEVNPSLLFTWDWLHERLEWVKRKTGRSMLTGLLSVKINHVMEEHAGLYVCKRYLKESGHVDEVTVKVTVVAPRKPIIQTRALKKEIKTRKGSKILTEISVELICDLIDGKPIYDFKWSNSRGKTVKCCKFAPCILKVGDAEDEKIHGRYTCTASNSLGASSRSIFLNTAMMRSFPRIELWKFV